MTTETVFRWASLSKGVAADMVVLLADRRQLSLFEPVSRYSASLRLPGGNEDRATVSDLLSHRLGLFAHAQDPRLEEGWDPQLSARLARLAAQYLPAREPAMPIRTSPMTRPRRSSSGSPARAIPKRCASNLFAPLGMSSASVTRAELEHAAAGRGRMSAAATRARSR